MCFIGVFISISGIGLCFLSCVGFNLKDWVFIRVLMCYAFVCQFSRAYAYVCMCVYACAILILSYLSNTYVIYYIL